MDRLNTTGDVLWAPVLLLLACLHHFYHLAFCGVALAARALVHVLAAAARFALGESTVTTRYAIFR